MSKRKPHRRTPQPGDIKIILSIELTAGLLVVLREGLEHPDVIEMSELYQNIKRFTDDLQNSLFASRPDLLSTLKQLNDSIESLN
ncbi:hypothetical protein [Chamaesiphon sp. VAR_48_metabat_403]|uniref:hypothetical protein n=1 Tax=Chamaesiphon sp. VAR_48_metabat_403 TaxID=2964700 RepID=UPI00286E5430|nr:hypothetical protein [Chamaesiphon sp. VAR_48_metabat_403]